MGPEASQSGRWIEINGARLYYDDRGAGPPIVLIHAGLISRAISIIITSSVVELMGFEGISGYIAAKHAQVG